MTRPLCTSCRRPLSANYAFDTETVVEEKNTLFGIEVGSRTTGVRGALEGYGYQSNGFFCSKSCGFRWAVREMRKGKEGGG